MNTELFLATLRSIPHRFYAAFPGVRGASVVLILAFLTGVADARYCNNPYCSMCNRIFGPMILQPTPAPIQVAAVDSTPQEAVEAMVELADLSEDDLLYDPGCGDGRIIEAAVRSSGCKALGIEIDAGIAARARARLRRVLPSRWRVTTGDATRLDLSQATVACLYHYPSTLARIVPRLRNATRIISYSHPVPGYKNRRVETSKGPVYVVDRRSLTYDCAVRPRQLAYEMRPAEPPPITREPVRVAPVIFQPLWQSCAGGGCRTCR